MNQIEIKHKREFIDTQINNLGAQIEELQRGCTHPNASHKNGADTGNYSPSDDSYWTDHYCPDCSKYWQTDQQWKNTK